MTVNRKAQNEKRKISHTVGNDTKKMRKAYHSNSARYTLSCCFIVSFQNMDEVNLYKPIR